MENCTERNEFYVSAQKGGQDSKDCLVPNNMNFPCASFKYLVLHVLGRCSNYVLLDPTAQLDEVLVFNYSEVSIVGNHTTPVTLFCQNNSGLVFTSDGVLLDHLLFSGCSLKVSDYLNDKKWYPTLMSLFSSIMLQQLKGVKIFNCSFSEHAGSALALLDVNGTIDIENCTFNGKASLIASAQSRSGGIVLHTSIHQIDVNVSIRNSNFSNNINMGFGNYCRNATSMALNNVGHGGALDIMLETNAVTFILYIVGCTFEHNRAMRGGALSIYFMGIESNFNISLLNSYFISNSACLDGGAIVFASDKDIVSKSHDFSALHDSFAYFTMTSCHLNYNSAETGGGLAAYIKGCSSCNSFVNLLLTDSHWLMNEATMAGYALWLGSTDADWYWALTRFRIESQCVNCTFLKNFGASSEYNSAGAVIVYSATILFANTVFNYNANSALVLMANAVANFCNGRTTFRCNEGVIGGAIQLQDNSSLYIGNNGKIIFDNNNAIVAGGAIYSKTTKSIYCIFYFQDDAGTKQIFFINNTVQGKAQSIFVEYAEKCEFLLTSVKLSFIIPSYTQIMFPPTHVKLALAHSKNGECNQDFHQAIKVSLGEKFNLMPVSVLDRFSRLSLNWTGHIWIKPAKSGLFSLKGPTTITIDSLMDCNSFHFHIEGVEVYNDTLVSFNVEFYFLGESGYNAGTTVLHVTVTPCGLGFKFSNGTCQCVKVDHVQCVSSNSMVCVSNHYWYGIININSTLPCPVNNCKLSRQCPVQTQLQQNLSSYCCVTDSNGLCREGRGKVLCSECIHSHSFTFGALQCVDAGKSCSEFYTLLLFLALLVYWIICCVGLHALLSVNLTVGSGVFYGVVYYFSIVTIYTNHTPLFSKWWLRIPIYISTMVTQLNPEVLGFAEVCFIESWVDPLNHLFFHYATPLFVVSLIIMFALVLHCCKCCQSLVRGTSIITYSSRHVISMLIVLSYSTMTSTSTKLLVPLEIGSKLFVKAAPSLVYFSGRHIAFGTVALFVECFISLPICITLLIVPWLSTEANTITLKFKILAEEFQACFHNKHQWFVGLYFSARLCFFLINELSTGVLPQHNGLLTAINVFTLTAVILLQPYKKTWLNVLDTILLINVILVSQLSLPISDDEPDSGMNYTIHSYLFPVLLIIFPVSYLALIFVIIPLKKSKLFCERCRSLYSYRIRTNLNTSEHGALLTSSDGSENNMTSPIRHEHSFYESNGHRPPLADDNRGDRRINRSTESPLNLPSEETSARTVHLLQ